MVVVIVVVVVAALVVAGVIAVVVYRRRAKLNAANADGRAGGKATEMEALTSSGTSSSLGRGQRRRAGLTAGWRGNNNVM
jgi:hypothetical protein